MSEHQVSFPHWTLQPHTPMENAPYLYRDPRDHFPGMQLFVQPMQGDGLWYKVIIQHDQFTLVLKKHFRSLNDAQLACVRWAQRLK